MDGDRIVIRDKKTGVEVKWEDGILTCTHPMISELLEINLKLAAEIGPIVPEHYVVDNPEAPEHTRDAYNILGLCILGTRVGRALLPDPELVEFSLPGLEAEMEEARRESTLPNNLVVY